MGISRPRARARDVDRRCGVAGSSRSGRRAGDATPARAGDDPSTRALTLASIATLYAGKVLKVRVPFALQRALDSFGGEGGGDPRELILTYMVARIAASGAAELKTALFARSSQVALREEDGVGD